MRANFQENKNLWIFGPKFAKKWILGSKFQKSKSGFGINTSNIPCVPIFSQDGQLLIFRPKFGKLASYVQYFGSNIVEGVAESLVETELSWVEVDGAGWSCVEVGARFNNTQYKSFQDDKNNKWLKNINKTCVLRI